MPNVHPLVVHFPIALIIVVAACDLVGILWGRKLFIQAATIVSVFAALGAIAAVITGLLAEDSVWHPEAAHGLLETHETVGLVFLGFVIVLAMFRLAVGKKLYDGLKWVGFLIALAASGIVAYGGYLGGEMVFTYGAGVKAAQINATKADSLNIEMEQYRDLYEGENESEREEETDHHH